MATELDLQLITGVDIPIPACQITLHQPTIKEIAYVGEKNFFMGAQIFLLMGIEKKGDLEKFSDFQILTTLLLDKEHTDFKKRVMEMLRLCFPGYEITLTPRALLFNFQGENCIIDENNFSSLQQVLRQVCCISRKDNMEEFNPADDVAAEIARKLQRGRERVAAQKRTEEGNSSVFSQYLSVLSIGLGIPLNQTCNMTIYQVYDLMERYALYRSWDIDLRARLAGGKPNRQVDDWTKIIHK